MKLYNVGFVQMFDKQYFSYFLINLPRKSIIYERNLHLLVEHVKARLQEVTCGVGLKNFLFPRWPDSLPLSSPLKKLRPDNQIDSRALSLLVGVLLGVGLRVTARGNLPGEACPFLKLHLSHLYSKLSRASC